MSSRGNLDIGRWFQSEFILRAARMLYLGLAALAFFAGLLGLAVAAFFELINLTPEPASNLPPAYVPGPKVIDPVVVAATLNAPEHIRFIVTRPAGNTPFAENTLIGFFDASTPNGLDSYPQDFVVVGGANELSFDRTMVNGTVTAEFAREHSLASQQVYRRAGLMPRPELVASLNNALATLKEKETKSYSLKVVARDRFGHTSNPADVNVVIELDRAAPAGAPPAIQISDLQQLAREIAFKVDPARTALYDNVLSHAQRLPRECGTSDNDAEFVSGFRHTFDTLKARVVSSNVEAFLQGVCTAWNLEVARQARLADDAEAVRARAMAREMAARAAFGAAQFGASAAKWAALSFAAFALALFMMVSLSLAFLAIEGHTNAMRKAVEALAAKSPS